MENWGQFTEGLTPISSYEKNTLTPYQRVSSFLEV